MIVAPVKMPTPLDRGVHRLDDNLLRAAHLVDDQPEAATGQSQHQDVLDAGRVGVRRVRGQDLRLVSAVNGCGRLSTSRSRTIGSKRSRNR